MRWVLGGSLFGDGFWSRRGGVVALTRAPSPRAIVRRKCHGSLAASAGALGTPVGSRPVLESLRYYGLVEWEGGDVRVTNAGLLLFVRRPALRWHPRAGLRVFRVAGTRVEHGRHRNVKQVARADPPLARSIIEVREAVRSQVRVSEKLRGLFFEETPEYPEFAWQEALVNAVAHRDYEALGRETEVWFLDDRLEVASTGELLPPVTVETLRDGIQAHFTRNPMLVRVLADAEIMCDEGEGVARVFCELAVSLLREPEIESSDGLFRMGLFSGPVSEAMRPGWRHVLGTVPISGGQRRMLLTRSTDFTARDYQRINGTSEDEDMRRLLDLCEKDIAEHRRGGEGLLSRFSVVLGAMESWPAGLHRPDRRFLHIQNERGNSD